MGNSDVGSWYSMRNRWNEREYYVMVNGHGTVEKIGRAPWYRVIILFLANVIGKWQSVAEVRGYLGKGRRYFTEGRAKAARG